MFVILTPQRASTTEAVAKVATIKSILREKYMLRERLLISIVWCEFVM